MYIYIYIYNFYMGPIYIYIYVYIYTIYIYIYTTYIYIYMYIHYIYIYIHNIYIYIYRCIYYIDDYHVLHNVVAQLPIRWFFMLSSDSATLLEFLSERWYQMAPRATRVMDMPKARGGRTAHGSASLRSIEVPTSA